MNNLITFALCIVVGLCPHLTSCSPKPSGKPVSADKVINEEGQTLSGTVPTTGAEQINTYLPLLGGKRIALVVNQTSLINKTHLADTLLSIGVKVVKIFSPEHGFRGEADAGEKVNNETDKKTGLPIVSLYGNSKKPSAEVLKDVDIVLFDIQDVGVRFYTYIGTLHYVMQACAENGKTLIVLDRPNPNGNYISGPVLEPKFTSFVGMHPVPIVHGLTIGEYAQMINGENWLDSGKVCKVEIIKLLNYTHKDNYSLPVKPSPNLPNDHAIQLYPSLGLFEGTVISMGRGTDTPFQILGAPNPKYGTFTFIPRSIPGMSKNPPHEGKTCYGIDLRKKYPERGLHIKYLLEFYRLTEDKTAFFNNFFNKLAGNEILQAQIKGGMSEQLIRASWEPGLIKYKERRKKYLLYPDFY